MKLISDADENTGDVVEVDYSGGIDDVVEDIVVVVVAFVASRLQEKRDS